MEPQEEKVIRAELAMLCLETNAALAGLCVKYNLHGSKILCDISEAFNKLQLEKLK